MKRTHNNNVASKVDNTNPKWVVARVHPANEHFQFMRIRRWHDWTNSASAAAIFDSRDAALSALVSHNYFDHMDGAFISEI